MIVAIIGSRSLGDNGKKLWGYPVDYVPIDGKPLVAWAVRKSGFAVTKVLSGGAVGIDTAAVEWARQHAIPYEVFPADWRQYGRRAGHIRNYDMTLHEQACIAIHDGTSHGTANKLACSAAAGHKTYVLLLH